MATLMQEESTTTTQQMAALDTNTDKKRPRRRVLKFLLFIAIVAVGVMSILPQLLSTSSMRQQIADSMLEDFDGKLEIGGADLAWWKPAELSSVTMTDKQGATMATIESATVSQPLWHMLWPSQQPLELKINRPVITYEIDAYGRTNWEKVMQILSAPAKEKKSGSSFGWPEFRHQGQPLNITIVDGQVKLKDHVSERTISAEKIQAKLKKSAKLIEGVLTANTQLIAGPEGKMPAGDVQAQYKIVLAENKVVAGDVSGKVRKTPLELIQPWLKQAVPHLHLATGSTDGEFTSKWTGDFRSGLKLSAKGTLQASDVSVHSTQWIAANELVGKTLTGKFAIDNTLPTAPGKFAIDWTLDGARLSPLTPLKLAEMNQALESPVAASPLTEPLAMGPLQMKTTGIVDVVKQLLTVDQAAINSELFSLQLAGTVRNFATGPAIYDLTGTSQGDILPLALLVRPELKDTTSGQRLTAEEFAIRGQMPAEEGVNNGPVAAVETPVAAVDPTESADSADNPFDEAPLPFSIAARWTWQELEVYGVPSRKGNLWTRYEDEQLKIVPVDLQVGASGEFLGKAIVDFRNGRRLLKIDEGYILKDVAFTQPMCRTWLKYVAPVFAEATDIQGQFSLYLTASVIDLDTNLADPLAGVLQIQNCRLGPGPLILEATAPIRGIGQLNRGGRGGALEPGAKWVELPKQDVLFKKVEGRVYHEQLVFQTGKVTTVSSGSVGDDQTLDMTVSIPLDFIREGSPLAQVFKQPIQIGVKGTLKQPRIDASQAKNIGKQIGVDAVEGLLKGLLNRRRNR